MEFEPILPVALAFHKAATGEDFPYHLSPDERKAAMCSKGVIAKWFKYQREHQWIRPEFNDNSLLVLFMFTALMCECEHLGNLLYIKRSKEPASDEVEKVYP